MVYLGRQRNKIVFTHIQTTTYSDILWTTEACLMPNGKS